jgi:hypothetical protein
VREENAACGRRFGWLGDLYAMRAPDDDTETVNRAVDGYANLVAKISAACDVSRGRPRGQLDVAIACASGFL